MLSDFKNCNRTFILENRKGTTQGTNMYVLNGQETQTLLRSKLQQMFELSFNGKEAWRPLRRRSYSLIYIKCSGSFFCLIIFGNQNT